MKTNPAARVSECEGQQAHTHVMRAMWWLFRGKPLIPKGGGETLQSCLLGDERPPETPGGPRRHVTLDRFQVHCSKVSAVHVSAPGALMGIVFAAAIGLCLNRMFQLFHVQIYLHLTLLVSIYPSTQLSRTSSA